ncbi:MAG: BrnT family toxin [Nitrosomonadales bacterium]|nr:BrnT family toxin [Nitrosomonadales bacterium]
MRKANFDWDKKKDLENFARHGVSFVEAQYAFTDPKRIIAEDLAHSEKEQRFFCFGIVEGGVMTVRFTYRAGVIRIIGAGYWRKGKKIYEQENQIHG